MHDELVLEFLRGGEQMLAMGQCAELIELCTAFLNEREDERVYSLLAAAHFALGDLEAAERAARDGRALGYRNPDHAYNLACIMKAQGRVTNAWRFFARAAALAEGALAEDCLREMAEIEGVLGVGADVLQPKPQAKRVLVIAAIFPPESGSGVQRTLKLVKYLRLCGWEPVVVTLEHSRPAFIGHDYLDELPDDIEVVRVPFPTFYDLGRAKALLLTFLSPRTAASFEKLWAENDLEVRRQLAAFPEAVVSWAYNLADTIEKYVDMDTITAVYSTSGPYSDHFAGYYIKQRFGKPWIVDFRDEWSHNPIIWPDKNNIFYHMCVDAEATIFKAADQIVCIAQPAVQNCLKMGVPAGKLTAITNGYDEEDFEGIEAAAEAEDRFTLVHNGLLYMNRTPFAMLEAIKGLIEGGQVDRDKIVFHLGNFTDDAERAEVLARISQMGLEGVARVTPYMEHRKSLNFAASAHMLVLVLADMKGDAGLTGKVFEYMRFGQPVLVLGGPGSTAARVLDQAGCPHQSFAFQDIAGVQRYVLKGYRRWQAGKGRESRPGRGIEVYERRALTARHAEVFHRAVADPLTSFKKKHPGIRLLIHNSARFPAVRPEGDCGHLSEHERKILENKDGYGDANSIIAGLIAKPPKLITRAWDEFNYQIDHILPFITGWEVATRDKDHIVTARDSRSLYCNTVAGHRVTADQPDDYSRTIWHFGYCHVFGNGAPDYATIASFLQHKLISHGLTKVRVENYGYSGIYKQWHTVTNKIVSMEPLFGPQDIILVETSDENPGIEGAEFCDVRDVLQRPHNWGEVFYDRTHLTENGNRAVADALFHALLEKGMLDESQEDSPPQKASRPPASLVLPDAEHEALRAFLEHIRPLRPQSGRDSSVGALVMNCNPFTNGHRYLIEHAAAKVEHLFIFVVEEDRSFFPFADRIRLVRAGTEDLANVTVLPSGKFIISSLTFVDYFGKEEWQDGVVDSSLDVTLFGQYIAPALGITVRFVGEEPFDPVTRQYNDALKRTLPQYGVALEIIPRKAVNGLAISASNVRRLLKEKNFAEIGKLVPPVTLEYLKATAAQADSCDAVAGLSVDQFIEQLKLLARHHQFGQMAEQIEVWHERGRPEVGVITLFYGICQNVLGHFDRALAAHQKALALDPSLCDIKNRRPRSQTPVYDERDTACIGCGSDSGQVVWVCNQSINATNYDVLNPIRVWKRCGACGLTYAAGLPSDSALAQYYAAGSAAMQRGEKSDISQIGDMEGYLRYSANRLARIEAKLGRKGRLLDIGAGIGTFVHVAAEQGWDAAGVEFSPTDCQYARDHFGLELIETDFYAFVPPHRVQAVTLLEVIEHLTTPWQALEKCAGFLEPGGVLVIATPFQDSDYVKALHPNDDFWWREPAHLCYMDTQCLIDRAALYGLVCTDIIESEQGHGRLEVYFKKS